MENRFLENKPTLRTEDLLAVTKETKSLSVTLGDQIAAQRKVLTRYQFKAASLPQGPDRSI